MDGKRRRRGRRTYKGEFGDKDATVLEKKGRRFVIRESFAVDGEEERYEWGVFRTTYQGFPSEKI